MKRFLFQIKPKFLFNALIFLVASTVDITNAALKPRYNFSETPPIGQEPIIPDQLTTTEPAPNPRPPETPSDESYDFSSNLIIKAVNPGYTNADKLTNVGELIELQNLADTSISLAGFSLRYTNSSDKASILHTFTEGDLMTGEFLLMRYAKSPDAEQAELTYSVSLAMTAGPLELIYDGELIDSVCWTGKDDCAKSFKSSSPTTLVHNLLSGDFEHLADYEPHFDSDSPNFYSSEPESDLDDPDNQSSAAPQCRGLEFSEILTYYSDNPAEQFIEFYNSTSSNISLDGCKLEYKKKTYLLSGNISSGTYLAYYPSPEFTFTKNPTTNNSVLLVDADGETVDELVYVHGQKKSTSFAKFYNSDGIAEWKITYTPTPNSPNNSQDFRTCPAGKVLNPVTGNCVNLVTSTTTECPAGKYRNPLTGRCKNIEDSTSTLKECAEGYERNPLTNRCRKITIPNEGADYALVPTTSSSKTTFAALGIVILIVSLGVIYIALQFRHETARAIRKIRQRGHHILENHFSRKVRRNRNKKT